MIALVAAVPFFSFKLGIDSFIKPGKAYAVGFAVVFCASIIPVLGLLFVMILACYGLGVIWVYLKAVKSGGKFPVVNTRVENPALKLLKSSKPAPKKALSIVLFVFLLAFVIAGSVFSQMFFLVRYLRDKKSAGILKPEQAQTAVSDFKESDAENLSDLDEDKFISVADNVRDFTEKQQLAYEGKIPQDDDSMLKGDKKQVSVYEGVPSGSSDTALLQEKRLLAEKIFMPVIDIDAKYWAIKIAKAKVSGRRLVEESGGWLVSSVYRNMLLNKVEFILNNEKPLSPLTEKEYSKLVKARQRWEKELAKLE
jgi:hypothetical protein